MRTPSLNPSLKLILSLTILVTSQLSFAGVGQMGCTNDMVVEAETIMANANQSFLNGATSTRSTLRAELNLIQVKICARKVPKDIGCAQMKRAVGPLVETEKRSVVEGASTYADLIEATKSKNEIEIFCKK